ncbi:hypothetical protein PR048_014051 [Dryococelus australis]|uniref:Uncharacterized protein n=1 Tax=Dryococelus australis TaxID=614101 RepID=A0ABQ9HTX0_9NEOP|nr:hypothetical protein PR048_014051 [Dryococelus australis]
MSRTEECRARPSRAEDCQPQPQSHSSYLKFVVPEPTYSYEFRSCQHDKGGNWRRRLATAAVFGTIRKLRHERRGVAFCEFARRCFHLRSGRQIIGVRNASSKACRGSTSGSITDLFFCAISDQLGIVGPDSRRKHNNHRKTDEVTLQSIRSHMKSFPVIESPTTYELRRRHYLHGSLFIPQMYRPYKEKCRVKYERCGFFQPKKYKCVFCMQYNTATDEKNVRLEVRSYSNQEEFDMLMVLGECRQNHRLAERVYARRYQDRPRQSRHVFGD